MTDPDQGLGSLRLCPGDKGVLLEIWDFKRCIWSLGGDFGRAGFRASWFAAWSAFEFLL